MKYFLLYLFQRFVKRLPEIFLSILIILLITLGYWAFFDVSPIYVSKFTNSIPAQPIVVYHGDTMVYNYFTDYLKVCEYEVHRAVRNLDTKEIYQASIVKLEITPYMVGKTLPYQTKIYILSAWPPGNYEIYPTIYYYCNPLEHIFPKQFIGNKIPFSIMEGPNPKNISSKSGT